MNVIANLWRIQKNNKQFSILSWGSSNSKCWKCNNLWSRIKLYSPKFKTPSSRQRNFKTDIIRLWSEAESISSIILVNEVYNIVNDILLASHHDFLMPILKFIVHENGALKIFTINRLKTNVRRSLYFYARTIISHLPHSNLHSVLRKNLARRKLRTFAHKP